MRCLCGSEVVVAPVALHIPYVQDHLRKDFKVAAQNAWVKGNGAYTGELRCAKPPAFLLMCKVVVVNCQQEDSFPSLYHLPGGLYQGCLTVGPGQCEWFSHA